jgi:uncharacterized membrane protein AbrB (regulator of aidB expression)
MKWSVTAVIMAFGLLILIATNTVFEVIYPDAPDWAKVISVGVIGGLFGVALAFVLRFIRRSRATPQL